MGTMEQEVVREALSASHRSGAGSMNRSLPYWVSHIEQSMLDCVQAAGIAQLNALQSIESMNLMCVQIGAEAWEHVSAQPHVSLPHQQFNFVSVKDFERDIVTWMRAWGNPEFTIQGRRVTTMHAVVNVILTQLKYLQAQVSVAYPKLTPDMVTIIVKSHHNAQDQYMLNLPMYSSPPLKAPQ